MMMIFCNRKIDLNLLKIGISELFIKKLNFPFEENISVQRKK